jgi:hypothetical protein
MINELVSQLAAGSLGGRVVRVSVSADLHNNFDAMTRVTKSVLGKLGCEGCHSGFDIRFDVASQFVADEKGTVRALGVQG